MLLVHHCQPQAIEDHTVLDQSMGPHQNIDHASFKLRQEHGPLALFGAPGQDRNSRRDRCRRTQQMFQARKELASQNLGGCHDCCLKSGRLGLHDRSRGHDATGAPPARANANGAPATTRSYETTRNTLVADAMANDQWIERWSTR